MFLFLGSVEILSFAAPDAFVYLVISGATLMSHEVRGSSLAINGKDFYRACF